LDSELISAHGYLALFTLMFMENVFPPIPSELIMPFAGYAAARGDINPIGAVIAGSAGSLLGAFAWYVVGVTGSAPNDSRALSNATAVG